MEYDILYKFGVTKADTWGLDSSSYKKRWRKRQSCDDALSPYQVVLRSAVRFCTSHLRFISKNMS